MSALSLAVTGSVVLSPSNDCSSSVAQGSTTFPVGIRSETKAPTADVGQQRRTVTSPASFVALGVPAGFVGRFLHLRVADGDGGPITVRVTFATAGTREIPVLGLLQIEAPSTDAIEDVEVQGSATFSWLLTGSAS